MERFGKHAQTSPAIDYTGNMLQRTTGPLFAPERLDYAVVERVARDMRTRYIASLFGSAKGALASRLARVARLATGRAR